MVLRSAAIGQTAGEILICPTPTPGTELHQIILHPWARKAGLVPGAARVGMVTSQIEPCIIASI